MGADAVYEPRATVADAENWLALETDFFERADMLDTNKLQTAMANVTPAGVLAEQHRKMAEPGSAKKARR